MIVSFSSKNSWKNVMWRDKSLGASQSENKKKNNKNIKKPYLKKKKLK